MTMIRPQTPSDVRAKTDRPRVKGKFLFVGDEKLYVRGVTYGTFRPDGAGREFSDSEQVERDFSQMASSGINTVRTYTVPPRWLLDAALSCGLKVMVGIPWEQHVAFLDEGRGDAIEETVREGVRACAGHPAVLSHVIGNEIPAPIVRWHGRRRIERFLKRLYEVAKAEDPEGIVAYVNYPTTEYLDVGFIDVLCFNVYLESQDRLEAYMARLQNIAGDRPLIMTEIGLDSRKHGEEEQARALDWQVRSAFAAGCAGAIVFAWTDEWFRGGYDIDDWDFGLTDRARRAKPALTAVRNAFAEVPFPEDTPWPRISVVVCSYNGERTIHHTLEALGRLEYPDFEVIVVNDGSTDATAAIAREYNVRLISTENRGLGSARNTGMEASTGEVVAYIDDDAYPDSHWLQYLADTFRRGDYSGVGGPNIAPPGDGPIADSVASAPGGPIHVLLSDREAEHIPGCNMSFRREALQAVGGFDPQFGSAGDDVDMCWRLQERGWTLGFSPGAMVWHHRRNSVRMYWKQQQGYGKAEALLERKWPEKYNGLGHLSWSGRLYGKGIARALTLWPTRIYQGTWGGALFQSVYRPAPATLPALTLMPEWNLVIASLAALSALGILWTPLLLALPLLALAIVAPIVQAVVSAARAPFTASTRPTLGLRVVTAFLHLLQPVARLMGRLRAGLTIWRRRGRLGFSLPVPRTATVWSETWRPHTEWVASVEGTLRQEGAVTLRGGDFDRWDLEVRGGILGAARARVAVEEHGAGKQLARVRGWPTWSVSGFAVVTLFVGMSGGAALDGAWVVSAVLGAVAAVMAVRMVWDAGAATAALWSAVSGIPRKEHE